MITVTVSATDRQRPQREPFDNPHPRVQRKLDAVSLVGLGQSRPRVAQNVGVTEVFWLTCLVTGLTNPLVQRFLQATVPACNPTELEPRLSNHSGFA
jgi:hypothetical protein